MYLYAREWNIQPSEFWNMTISEWWLEYESKTSSQTGEKFAGKLTRADVDDLKAWMDEKNGAS